MILSVDIGNTSIKAGVYDENDRVLYQDSILTDTPDWKKEYRVFFEKIRNQDFEVKDYIVSSVVPRTDDYLRELLQELFEVEGHFINAALVSDLMIHLKDRNELGADLIASTYGALSKYEAPVIVADLGTATKITVIDEKGEFLGGMILPGITISNRAMQMLIPHLPRIQPELPEKLLNEDTEKCMQAGLMYGTIYQIRGIADRLEEELGFKANKVLTGGYGRNICHELPEFRYEESLIEDGIMAIYHRYCEEHH